MLGEKKKRPKKVRVFKFKALGYRVEIRTDHPWRPEKGLPCGKSLFNLPRESAESLPDPAEEVILNR